MSYAYLPPKVISQWFSLSLIAKAVIVSIASFMDGKAEGCYPSILAIKKRTGLKTDKAVRKALKELKSAGLLSIQERPGRSSLFGWAEPLARDDGGTESVPLASNHPRTQTPPLASNHPRTQTPPPSVERPPTPSVSRPEPLASKYPRRIKKKDTKKDITNSPPDDASTGAPPKELSGMHLYEADTKLCKAFPELMKSWSRAYSGMDILTEIAKAHAWEVANPSKRKTDRARFLTNWFARASNNPQSPKAQPDQAELEFEKASNEYGNSGIEDRIAAEAQESGGGVQ